MFCSAVSWDGRRLVGATSWQSPAAEFGCAVAAPPGMNAQQQGLATALLKTPEPGNASPRAGAPGTWGQPGKKGFGGILETPGTSGRAVSIPAGCGAPQSDAACRSHLTSEAPLSRCQNNDFSALGLKSQLPVNPAGRWEWLPTENPVCAPVLPASCWQLSIARLVPAPAPAAGKGPVPLLCPRGIYWHLLPTLQGHQPRSWLAAAHAVGTNRHSQPGTAAARADIQLGTARCCWRRCPGRAQHLRCPAGTRSSPPVPALSPRLLRCPSAAAGTSGRAGPADERETSAPTPCQEYLPAGCVLRGHGCSYISCCAEMGPQHG